MSIEVGIIMGSDSDLPVMAEAAKMLDKLGVEYELSVVSAHRTPDRMFTYAKTAKELEEMTGRTYSRIHIVGGGSNAGYLNELTAKATKKEIHAGPGEATALGNITAQMLKAEEFKTIVEARTIIHESFGVKVYK